jgi:hypothetical protein
MTIGGFYRLTQELYVSHGQQYNYLPVGTLVRLQELLHCNCCGELLTVEGVRYFSGANVTEYLRPVPEPAVDDLADFMLQDLAR